jgi:hypothetical protein
MEREIDNVLEALVNLFYLIKSVEPGSLQQSLYVEMAEDIVNREVERRTRART